MQLTVSGSTRKKRIEDRFSNDKDQFYETIIKPFVSVLIMEIKGAFDMSDIPILLVLMRLDHHLKLFMSFMEMSEHVNLVSTPEHVKK